MGDIGHFFVKMLFFFAEIAHIITIQSVFIAEYDFQVILQLEFETTGQNINILKTSGSISQAKFHKQGFRNIGIFEPSNQTIYKNKFRKSKRSYPPDIIRPKPRLWLICGLYNKFRKSLDFVFNVGRPSIPSSSKSCEQTLNSVYVMDFHEIL